MGIQSFDDPDSDDARQFLLDRKCERKHPKRHRTMKREKALTGKKRAKVQHQVATRERNASNFKAKVRAYWLGLSECHP